jgi:hypothetical protein
MKPLSPAALLATPRSTPRARVSQRPDLFRGQRAVVDPKVVHLAGEIRIRLGL